MIKTKLAFLDGRLLFSQSEQFKKLWKALFGWKKASLLKKPFLFWSCKQANSLDFYTLHFAKRASTKNHFKTAICDAREMYLTIVYLLVLSYNS